MGGSQSPPQTRSPGSTKRPEAGEGSRKAPLEYYETDETGQARPVTRRRAGEDETSEASQARRARRDCSRAWCGTGCGSRIGPAGGRAWDYLTP